MGSQICRHSHSLLILTKWFTIFGIVFTDKWLTYHYFFLLADIPSRLILTKVDTLDLCNAGSLNEIFQSRQAEKKVNDAKNIFNFQDCEIWPVANYVKGITQNITQDVLALLSLDNILEEAITYIENQL